MFRIFVSLALLTSVFCLKSELKLQGDDVIGQVVLTPRPLFEKTELPASFDYRPLGLLTTDLNQHIPVYCGSCWAHAAMSSIADRLKIASKGQSRDVIPSIQALINCGNAGSCNGGDSHAANRYLYTHGLPDVTCQQYQAKNMECSAINTCMNCDPDTGCFPVKNYTVIAVSEYGFTEGDVEIMSEIYSRGPVSVYLNAECLKNYTSGISMYDSCVPEIPNHVVQINGWGSEGGVDYWIGRNSWGTYWGEQGFFRIVRGGALNVRRAYWAVPYIRPMTQ